MTLIQARRLCNVSARELSVTAKVDYPLLTRIEHDESIEPALQPQIWKALKTLASQRVQELSRRIQELGCILEHE